MGVSDSEYHKETLNHWENEIILLPFYMKLRLMKQFFKALNKNGQWKETVEFSVVPKKDD